MQLRRRLAALLIAGGAWTGAMAQASQGWVVDFTWNYEAQSTRTLREGRTGPGGADTRISATADARIAVQARGTMAFTDKLRGAAAVNMPDSRNEQRYDSWRFKGGRPAFASIDVAAQLDQAARLNQADGEGANLVNAERKGLIGRVQYERLRVEAKAAGDDAGWLGDHADLQIDRVANKLMIVNRIDLQPNRKVVKATRSFVKRMDKPAAAGEWDRSAPDEEAWRLLPEIMRLDKFEFDIPPGADQFTVTRQYEANQLPDPLDSLGWPFPSDLGDASKLRDRQYRARATLTLSVRRRAASEAASPAVAAPAAAADAAPQPGAAPPGAAPKPEPAKAPPSGATDEAIDAVRKLRGLLGR